LDQGLNWRKSEVSDQLRVELHKSETKDQFEKDGQLQGRWLNLAGIQLNWFENQNCNLGLD
jgi:hypothetical protein